ncbi:hypothetical protein EMN47_19225 [Prolixibacteraceae bacterium JC049]|nr:hypothetical protein [Prolixibacteraceae bacterium JC049]
MENKIYEGIFNVLEEEFKEIGRYISFTESNLKSYSIKIQELHLRVCSEVENLMKIVIHKHFLDKREVEKMWNSKQSNFLSEAGKKDEFEALQDGLNKRRKEKVEKLMYGYPDFAFYFELANEQFNLNKKAVHFLSSLDNSDELTVILPFETEKDRTVPVWWTSYNKMKHDKVNSFSICTLENLIYSFGGLFVLMNYLIEYQDNNNPRHEEFPKERVTSIPMDCDCWAFQSNHFKATNSIQDINISMQLVKDLMREDEYAALLEKYGKDLSAHFTEISKKMAFHSKLVKEENFIFHVYYDYKKLANSQPRIIYRKKMRFCKFTN